MFRFPLTSVSIIPVSLFLSTVALAQVEDKPVVDDSSKAATPEVETNEGAVPDDNADASKEDQADVAEQQSTGDVTDAEIPEDENSEESTPIEQTSSPDLGETSAGGQAAVPAAAQEGSEVEDSPNEPEAPSLLPLKVGTHTWSRAEIREGYDTLGVSRTRFQEGDQVVFRSRLTIETAPLKLTDEIEGLLYFAPQASGSWGTSGIGGTIGEANLGIYEGYFKLSGKMLEGKVGRFSMNYGDSFIIGSLDWHQAGRAFDGVHLRLKPGKVLIDTFLTQTTEGHPAINEPLFGGDNYFWGVYAQVGKAISESLALDLYALGKSAAATDITDAAGVSTHKDGATFVTLGVRAKQKIDILDYRVEGGAQIGKSVGPATQNLNKLALQVDGEVGLTFAKRVRVGLGGGIATGDNGNTTTKDEGWDELYPTGHKWLGLMDVIGERTNVVTGSLKLKANVTESTTAKLDAHLFTRVEDGGLGQSGADRMAGYEIDGQLIQKIGKFAYTRGLYGIFLPNRDYYGSASAAHYGELQAGLKF